MFNILPVRKLIKLLCIKRAAKRERELTSLTECLDKNVAEKSSTHMYFFVFLLILIYWIHLMDFNSRNKISLKKHTCLLTFMSSEDANKSSAVIHTDKIFPFCSYDKQKQSEIFINKSVTEISEVDYPAVQNGGYYTPGKCRSRHKVALIIPYRNRKENLATFLFNIHPLLMKQKLEYRIFVTEQKGTELFNRGRLFNAGFMEVQKYDKWRCVVFHDVDLLPLDERILYSCPTWPRHMCGTVVEVKNPTFRTLFGGVSAITPEHFNKVNGFSNLYWGWGGEDNDLFWRIRKSGLPIVRYNKVIARYTSLQHAKTEPNSFRFDLLATATKRYLREGLSTLQYKVDSVTLHHLYTHILIDINPNNENVTEVMTRQWR